MNDADPVQVRIEVTIAAPPEQVWAALRDPELIKRWHGWHFDGLDDEINEIYVKATEDAANWTIIAGGKDTFTLHEVDGGVIVRITRPERGHDPEWDAYYDDITEGWTTFLAQLKFAMERHGLAHRRTLCLTGETSTPVSELLGLPTDLQTADQYTVTTAPGDEISGSVYSRHDNQLMFAVTDWGDGLLVLAEQDEAPHHPRGGAMILCTFYGWDDARFEELSTRWTAWWESVKLPAEAISEPADA